MKSINLLVSLMILLLASCSKEISPDEEIFETRAISNKNNTKKTKLIKREVSFTVANPQLKIVKQFFFDQRNRVVKVEVGRIDSSLANPTFQVRQTLNFFYNGLNNLPHSMTLVRSFFPNLVTTYYYTYNQFNEKVMDSVKAINVQGQVGYFKVAYTHEGKNIFVTPYTEAFSLDLMPYDTLTLKNHNIERLIKKTFVRGAETKNEYFFTYDKHPNPFNKLNIYNSLYFTNSSMGVGYNVIFFNHYAGINRNNLLSYGIAEILNHFTYVYDADDYPLKQDSFLSGTSSPYEITYYQY